LTSELCRLRKLTALIRFHVCHLGHSNLRCLTSYSKRANSYHKDSFERRLFIWISFDPKRKIHLISSQFSTLVWITCCHKLFLCIWSISNDYWSSCLSCHGINVHQSFSQQFSRKLHCNSFGKFLSWSISKSYQFFSTTVFSSDWALCQRANFRNSCWFHMRNTDLESQNVISQ
jgi:hypothetical protein